MRLNFAFISWATWYIAPVGTTSIIGYEPDSYVKKIAKGGSKLLLYQAISLPRCKQKLSKNFPIFRSLNNGSVCASKGL